MGLTAGAVLVYPSKRDSRVVALRHVKVTFAATMGLELICLTVSPASVMGLDTYTSESAEQKVATGSTCPE